MKDIEKRLRQALIYILSVLVLTAVSGCNSQTNDISVSENDGILSQKVPEGEPVLSDENYITVGENADFKLDYDRAGADIYVTDKRSGKIWSNTVAKDYYTQEQDAQYLTQLLSVSIADKSGIVRSVDLFDNTSDSEFEIAERVSPQQNKLILTLEPAYTGISFEIEFYLDDKGLCCSIPESSLSEVGDDRIVDITLIPGFGAALPGEDGYIFYPDGSGALLKFDDEQPAVALTTLPYFGIDSQDLKSIEKNDEQNIYNLMLPVFGLSRRDGGFLAVITEGAADTNLNLAQPGYLIDMYRAYYTAVYRRFAAMTVNDNDVIELIPSISGGNRTVRYILLEPSACDYSAMANAYRDMLVSEGVLKKLPERKNVPLSVELFMSASEQGFFFRKNLKATDFSQAAEILEDISKYQKSELQVSLAAWSNGGSDNLPTSPKPSSSLGGRSEAEKLSKAARDAKATLYWYLEPLFAGEGESGYNKKKDVIRNHYGNIVSYDGLYLLNPSKVLNGILKKTLKSGGAFIENLQINSIGKYVIPDYMNGSFTSRQSVVNAYIKGLENVKKSGALLTAEGGNSYVLPYVAGLSDLPDGDSEYYISDGEVPFYQMVVHGYIDYTSTAGNLCSDFARQKLRWVEYGCNPYFILTAQNPNILKNSSSSEIFTSQYSEWKQRVQDTAKEFNERLGEVWNQPIVDHRKISSDVLSVTYENGSRIYINYGSNDVNIDGYAIPAEDYAVVKE